MGWAGEGESEGSAYTLGHTHTHTNTHAGKTPQQRQQERGGSTTGEFKAHQRDEQQNANSGSGNSTQERKESSREEGRSQRCAHTHKRRESDATRPAVRQKTKTGKDGVRERESLCGWVGDGVSAKGKKPSRERKKKTQMNRYSGVCVWGEGENRGKGLERCV